jgi:hypothetical protein
MFFYLQNGLTGNGLNLNYSNILNRLAQKQFASIDWP